MLEYQKSLTKIMSFEFKIYFELGNLNSVVDALFLGECIGT